MIVKRTWAMPNKWTFKIKPISELIYKYGQDFQNWIDPFAGQTSPAEITNDLNPNTIAKYNMKALDFSKMLKGKYNGVLFDPPYSGRQVKECYNELGIDVLRDDTNSFFYYSVKNELSKKIKVGGYAISFGWNSNGFGKKNGFQIVEILLVAHGAAHNDTICTVEKKVQSKLF